MSKTDVRKLKKIIFAAAMFCALAAGCGAPDAETAIDFLDYNDVSGNDGLKAVPETVSVRELSEDELIRYLGFDIREGFPLPDGFSWTEQERFIVYEDRDSTLYGSISFFAANHQDGYRQISIHLNPDRSFYCSAIGLEMAELAWNCQYHGCELAAGWENVYYGGYNDPDTVVLRSRFAAFQAGGIWFFLDTVGIEEEEFAALTDALISFQQPEA